ncbi:putative endonuclease containing a URI domain [Candidatus Velamenicoccus archaeovorus]|uniref:Putative endonuclease containing a URI domain n=1 Tax=Velamenicoccus archaeovorus TaxID=1930593 RepID=A0A410P3E1_VELA1|nr:GIY-YIG nuclease family protein [Candidatus Velamenicoccus archaeovorus]QAT16524.1 putative endonuclease containing a URI domain [Candidatus Velamenicoccus archaeovorus]
MWYVYIIECKEGSFYTGITNNLKVRIGQHNRGHGCRFTKFRIPVKLLYHEIFPSREAALKREAEIKGWTRERKLALIAERL